MFSAQPPPAPLTIAICGIRGVPACYGGFETFAEELGERLVKRGHRVIVYGRTHVIDYSEPSYKGMELRLLSAPQHKYLETPLHTLKCLLDLLRRPADVILVCNAANSPFVWLPRLGRMPVLVNVDGIERNRAKWNFVGRLWYRIGEISSVLFASKLVSDAEVIRKYYRDTYRCDSAVIAYGHRESDAALLEEKCRGKSICSGEIYRTLGIVPDDYVLYVSRLEPENNAHRVIAAYNLLPEELRRTPLVIVGDAPYAKEYIEELHKSAGKNVIFAGYRFDEDYLALARGARIYIQATEVGGTHPALVEAMGFANCIVANDVPEHRETLAAAGLYYAKNDERDLSRQLASVLVDSELMLSLRKAALERAKAHYNWDIICSNYEELFTALTRN